MQKIFLITMAVWMMTLLAMTAWMANSSPALSVLQERRIENSAYSLTVPSEWHTEVIGREVCHFGCREDSDIGGLRLRQYLAKGAEQLPAFDALIRWLLPDGASFGVPERLWGFPAETYRMDVTLPPAEGSGGSGEKWTYFIFIDRGHSGAGRFTAWELFFSRKFVTPEQALRVAQSFHLPG